MDGKRALKRLGLKKRSRIIRRHARRIEEATTRHAHRFLVSRWDKIREVRLHIIVWMASVGALIALVGVQMVWFQQAYITRAPIGGGTYAEALKGPIQTLNPLYATTPAELAATHLLFSSLYSFDTTGHLKGDLATGMVDDGNKAFTVHLRKDAHWQDGKPLTANDVVFTVNLMKDPSSRAVMAATWQGVSVETVDASTVKFTLPAAYAAFPQALTFAILPQHLLEKVSPASLRESTYSKAPVGSGPFTLRLLQTVGQSTGQKIAHMDANDNYYRGRPRLDHLQLDAYNDDASIVMALRTGEVTGASSIESDIVAKLDTKKYETVLRPLNDGVYVIFNTVHDGLKDMKVRQALQLATDTSAIRDHIFGHPQALYLPFVTSQVKGADKIAPPKVDPVAAGKLLDKDGWVMKDGVRTKGDKSLRLKVVTRKNADYEAALQELARQWHKIGVQVDSQIFDTSDPTQNFATDILQQRNYDVLLDDLAIGGDPDVFAYWHSQGLLNFSNFGDPKSDDYLSSARTTSDQTLRSLKYVAFAKQWLTDVPAIGLYQPNLVYIHSRSTQAVQPDEVIVSADNHFAGVRYWTAERGSVYKTP